MATITKNNNFHKILSLDGGGSWALIQAVALGDIYGLETPGRDILKHFKLAIANSGGSIVLAGLLMNMTPREIFNFFNDESNRKGIFDENLITMMGFRKYKTDSKITGLQAAFINHPQIGTPLSKISNTVGIDIDIVIPAFDYDRERATFFRSNAHSKTGGASDVPLIRAVHASSTAPVKFFDDPAFITDDKPPRYWDGGVGGYNNPVMAGVTEALANHPTKRENIRILSIGTGNNFLPLWEPEILNVGLHKPPQDPGLINDISLLARSIVSDPPDAASFTAHVVLGGGFPAVGQIVSDGPLVRMNPLVQPCEKAPINRKNAQDIWDFPRNFDHNEFIRLTELELDAVEQEDVEIIRRFTAVWLEGHITNQAIRADGKTLACEIGHKTYSGALAQWRDYDLDSLDPDSPVGISNRKAVLGMLR